jgi:hypothetical protein
MRHFGTLFLALALGLGAAGLPAAAQGLCGGVGDAGEWIGGTQESSDIATASAYLEQMALVLMGNEHVGLFSVSAMSDVRIEAQGRGAGDPVIDLRNEVGDIVMSDDDSGGNGAARVEVPLAPGTYCVSMRSYDGGPMTGLVRVGLFSHEALTTGVSEPAMPPDEVDDGGDNAVSGEITEVVPEDYAAGCDLEAAVPMAEGALDDMLAAGVTVTGSAADNPYLSFQLTGERMLTITAVNDSADPRIAIYDEYGTSIGDNDDADGLNARVDLTSPLWPGTYCIALTALSDTAQPIAVTVKEYDVVGRRIAKYEVGEAAPPMDGSYPVTTLGELTSRLRTDLVTDGRMTWFAIDVAEAGLVVVEAATNGEGDPVIVLFDDLGRQVGRNDDNGESLDSMIAARVLPGSYLVGVRQVGNQPDVPTRMVFERYVLAQ